MKKVLCLFLLSLVLISGQQAPAESLPEELTLLSEQLSTSGIEPVDERVNESLERLNENYRNALQRAIQVKQSAGNLESIIELKAEEDAIGGNLPEADDYQSDEVKRLASTYREHLEGILSRDESLRKDLAIRYRDSVSELIATLTKAGRLDDALATRDFLKSDEALDLVLTELIVIRPQKENLRANFRTILQGAPTNPSRSQDSATPNAQIVSETRLVFIAEDSTDAQIPPFRTFQQVEQLDRRDFAFVGNSWMPKLGLITTTGSLVFFDPGSPVPIEESASASSCGHSYDIPFVGLNDDGSISVIGSDSIAGETKTITDASHLATAPLLIALVKTDGTVNAFGPHAQNATPAQLETMSDVQEVEFQGSATATVLKKDGTLQAVMSGVIADLPITRRGSRLHGGNIIEEESGKLLTTKPERSHLLDQVGRNPKQVISKDKRFAAIRNDGSVLVALLQDDGTWEQEEQLEEALNGALSIQWIADQGAGWIAALLSAEKVPRSGLWKVEELIEARNAQR